MYESTGKTGPAMSNGVGRVDEADLLTHPPCIFLQHSGEYVYSKPHVVWYAKYDGIETDGKYSTISNDATNVIEPEIKHFPFI